MLPCWLGLQHPLLFLIPRRAQPCSNACPESGPEDLSFFCVSAAPLSASCIRTTAVWLGNQQESVHAVS